MAYHVELALRAARDLDHIYLQIDAAESIAAARWYNGLEEKIYSLERWPRRCPAAPESQRSQRALRHLLYGSRPRVYRVIFEIHERNKTVYILTIRHWAMDEVQPEELEFLI